MSDVETKMTFELLPNEVLLLCFEYFNAPDLFYTFDCLNSRLDKIIRNIPLCLHLEPSRRFVLDDFYQKMLANPQIKDKVIVIRVSQRVEYDATRILLSRFSLKEFTNLQSLKLIHLSGLNMETILPMFPFSSNLSCFNWSDWMDDLHWSEWKENIEQPLTSLPASTIQTSLDALRITDKYLSITKLTIRRCSVEKLCELFEYAPQLKHLTIKSVSDSLYEAQTIKKQHQSIQTAVNLKYLNMYLGSFVGSKSLEILFNHTPNLQTLVVQAPNIHKIESINAGLLQYLITSALPLLNIFKFELSTNIYRRKEKDIVAWFQEFQSDFWHQQHHWHTECRIDSKVARIYTIPYFSNTFELTLSTKRYCHASSNRENTFDKVTDLILSSYIMDKPCEFHFSNVKSLTLRKAFSLKNQNDASIQLGSNHIDRLVTIVNFDNLNHLDITRCDSMGLSLIFELLKKMPRLSSLRIGKDDLLLLINSDEACSYLKRIQKLDIELAQRSRIKNSDIIRVREVLSDTEVGHCFQTSRIVFSTASRELSELRGTKEQTDADFVSDVWNLKNS